MEKASFFITSITFSFLTFSDVYASKSSDALLCNSEYVLSRNASMIWFAFEGMNIGVSKSISSRRGTGPTNSFFDNDIVFIKYRTTSRSSVKFKFKNLLKQRATMTKTQEVSPKKVARSIHWKSSLANR